MSKEKNHKEIKKQEKVCFLIDHDVKIQLEDLYIYFIQSKDKRSYASIFSMALKSLHARYKKQIIEQAEIRRRS